MKKKRIIQIAAAVVLIAAGVFMIHRARSREEAMPAAKDYAMTISVMKPRVEQVQLTLPFLALAQNDQDVTLSSKISARVEFVRRSGNHVNVGDVIARLDNTSLETSRKSIEAQISSTKTALGNLRAAHERTLELLAVKGASIEMSESEESRIAELESKSEALTQSLNEIRNSLTYATITSPVDGQISKTNVNAGDVVMPGQPVATLSAGNGFYLMLYVPAGLKVYDVVLNDKTYDVIPLSTTFNGLSAYKAYVDSQDITTGERVEVNLVVYRGQGIKLPFDAILNRDGEDYVLVKTKDQARAVKIHIIQSGEDGAVISNTGLEGKELVVARQDILLSLLTGASIKVKED